MIENIEDGMMTVFLPELIGWQNNFLFISYNESCLDTRQEAIIDGKKNYVEKLFENGKQDESMKDVVGNVENILTPTTTEARDEVTKFETAEKFHLLIPPSPAPSG